MNKVVTFLILVFGTLTCMAQTSSGSCGDKLKYTLSGKTMTITGTGKMWNELSNSTNYWYGLRQRVDSVIIEPGVTSIGDNAFYNFVYLSYVSIPNTVTSIGGGAFMDCKCLHNVPIPEGITILENGTFQRSGIVLNTFPSTVKTLESAFCECNSLDSIDIPEGVETIGMDAFGYCQNLRKVKIPESVTYIGMRAFESCGNLTEITIPSGVETIDNFAFSGTKLSTVKFSEGLKTIGYGAFSSCPLVSLELPSTLEKVVDYAFTGCSSLTSITCWATTPPAFSDLAHYTFDGVDNSIPVYVPEESVDAYKADDNWSSFTNIQPISPKPIVNGDVTGDGELALSDVTALRYMLLGKRTVTSNSDYDKDGNTTVADLAEIIEAISHPKVNIVFADGSATVTIPKNMEADVKATVDGEYVTIDNANVNTELTLVVSGTTTNGGLTYNGDYKTSICLNGTSITSQHGASISVNCGKRVKLILGENTQNILADEVTGDQKACLYCKGHLELSGMGYLTVSGNAKHAIKTNEYLELKSDMGTLTILNSVGDAIHAGQYFSQKGGKVFFGTSTQGDGIQVEAILLDDLTLDDSKENNGQIMISGGTIEGTVAQEDCKAIKSDGDISITGGSITLTASGNGSRGIQTDGNMLISESDAVTSIGIQATGSKCTITEDVADPHNCMGIKVDGNLTIDGGTIEVANTGKKSKGIKVGGTYTKNGGTVTANVVTS